MLNSLRHPRRRGVSIGPQSEADAREFIASREKRRRDSRSAVDAAAMSPMGRLGEGSSTSNYFSPASPAVDEDNSATSADPRQDVTSPDPRQGRAPLLSPGKFPTQPLTPPASDSGHASDGGKEDEDENKMDQQMFLGLEKPRVRYDVEVVTKLVVYAGIAWLAVEGNPLLFEITGLGLTGLQR